MLLGGACSSSENAREPKSGIDLRLPMQCPVLTYILPTALVVSYIRTKPYVMSRTDVNLPQAPMSCAAVLCICATLCLCDVRNWHTSVLRARFVVIGANISVLHTPYVVSGTDTQISCVSLATRCPVLTYVYAATRCCAFDSMGELVASGT